MDMGKHFVDMTKNAESGVMYEVYKSRVPKIVSLIKKVERYDRILKIVDLGGGCGSLIQEIKKLYPKVRAKFLNVDVTADLLEQDTISDEKIHCNLKYFSGNNEFDIALMRLVLQFNSLETQELLIENAKRSIKDPGFNSGFFILQTVTATDELQQERLNTIFRSQTLIPPLYRPGSYLSTWEQLLPLFERQGLSVRVEEQYGFPIGDFFAQRYELTQSQYKLFQQILGDRGDFQFTISVHRKL